MYSIREALADLEIRADRVTLADVRQQHRELMKTWHPDLYPDPVEKARAEKKAKHINHAVDVAKEYFATHESYVSSAPLGPVVRKPKAAHRNLFHDYFRELNLEEILVRSREMRSYAYDVSTKKLFVRFKTDSIYCFFNVDPQVWREFQASHSKGEFLRYLKAYRHTRVA